MRRTLPGWQPCILIIIKKQNWILESPPSPQLMCILLPPLAEFNLTRSNFLPKHSICFQHSDCLPWAFSPQRSSPSSLLLSVKKKPVPRWESLSQRAAQKIQHCFEASRWAEFQLRLSQDTGLRHKVQFCTIHQEAIAQNWLRCTVFAVSAVFLFLLTISNLFIFFFCGLKFYSCWYLERKAFLVQAFSTSVFANRGGLRWSALSSKASTMKPI